MAMRRIVKTFSTPPTGRIRDRNGGLPRLSDGVAHASRCPASPQRTLLAENLGKPARRVMISAPWYNHLTKVKDANPQFYKTLAARGAIPEARYSEFISL